MSNEKITAMTDAEIGQVDGATSSLAYDAGHYVGSKMRDAAIGAYTRMMNYSYQRAYSQ